MEPSFRRAAANLQSKARTRCRAPGLLAAILSTLALAAGSSPPQAQAGGCEGAHTSPSKLSPKEARHAITCLINQKRDNAGLGSLDTDGRLEKAAQRHNSRMRDTGCFAHQCPGEASLETRLKSVGYLAGGLLQWSYAENVGWGRGGRGTPDSIVDAWMNSSGHRANILSVKFRDIGVGFNEGTPKRKRSSGGIYTVDFGLAIG